MKKNFSSSAHFSIEESRGSSEQSVRGASVSGDLHTVIPALQEEETNHSERGIVDELQKNPLISVHVNAVRNWSEIAFGEEGICDEIITKILEDPSRGNRVLWAIALNPQSIYKLAGKNICGFNDRARKNAMEGLSFLHDAIYGLVKTSKHAHNRMESQRGQSDHEKPIQGIEAVESLLKSYKSVKKIDVFDKITIEVFKRNLFIQKRKEEINYWCVKVFGRSDVLNEAVDKVTQNPRKVFSLLRQLTHNPETYHSLAGFNMCGLKSKERKKAESNMAHLKNCLWSYSGILRSAKTFLQIEHSEQQERGDVLHNQTLAAVAQNIQHARAEHHSAPQQERPRRGESGRMALAM
ncbi:BID domain-containing T4SS effector [Bartonella phoceensis]|uniref:BID domain-containing T4SS effector n=1 Tax=Bartonella phoceensis TaxID=270249 RepID=UPI001ABA92D4|nr:BID domain-containing T4SS effector [Bartonella phoceensis]